MGYKHVVPEIILKIFKSNQKLKIQGKGLNSRSFCYIDDFVSAFNLILKKGKHKNIYNIGTQEEIRIRDLVKRIISISDDFYKMHVRLKHSFWNRNPNKSIWGGSITSALDPFFPVMMKQILLRRGIPTDFLSKAVHVEFIKQVETHIFFQFKITESEVIEAEKILQNDGSYNNWHSVNGIDINGNICVKGKIQIYLRKK